MNFSNEILLHASNLLNDGGISVKEALNTVLNTLGLTTIQRARCTIVNTLVEAQVSEAVNGGSHLGLACLGLGPHSNFLLLRIGKVGYLVHRHIYSNFCRQVSGMGREV